jgi:hypothetical protein
MALNISEGQFVLPQSTVPDALAHLSQTLWQHNITQQRLDLAKEQKREQAGNFIEKSMDPAHFGTGTVYDPVITSSLNAARQQAVTLAQQGADIPTIMQAIGPSMNKINSYYNAAKTVSGQVDKTIKDMHDNKLDEGYNMADVRTGALKSAFITKDKDGNDTLVDPDNINLSKNYVQEAIKNDPGSYTNNEALLNYAKQSAKSTRETELTTHDQKTGNTTKKALTVTAANWEVPESDGKGGVGLVPKYDLATDNGEPINHTASDGTEQPARLFNEQAFDQMMAAKPGIADYVKGETMKYIKASGAKDSSGNPIDINSPQAKLIARGIAYKDLEANGNSVVKSIQDVQKPSPQQITLNLNGNQQTQAYNKETGTLMAKNDAGVAGIGPLPKENTVQAITKVFNNDPNYMDGPTKTIGGIPAVDITSKLPKAELKFGHGAKDTYKSVNYDPAGRQLLLEKPDGTIQKVPEGQAMQFAGGIAEANGVPLGAVKGAFKTAGYNNGTFGSAGTAPDIAGRATATAQAAHQLAVTKGTALLDQGDTGEAAANKSIAHGGLKGLTVPGGTVEAVNVRGGFRTIFGADKYSIDVKGSDGKVNTLTFKDKAGLNTFLNQNSTPKKSTDELGKQYGF